WFVPRGCKEPMSALPIQIADQYDFRAGSIGAMLEFLAKHKLLEDQSRERAWPTTLFLPHLFPPLLIVTGLPCAGKTTLGMHLSARCGYYHIEASDFMKLAFYERHGLRSQLSIHVFAERALREKPDIVVRPVIEEIERRRAELVVITGFRAPEELDTFIQDYGGPAEVQSWFIDVSEDIRFERSSTRARPDAAESRAAFRDRDRLQRKMGLRQIRRILGGNIVKNEASRRRYLSQCVKKLGIKPEPSCWAGWAEFRERPASLE